MKKLTYTKINKKETKLKGLYLFLILTINFTLLLNFLGEIFNGIFQIGFTDELAILFTYFLGFILLFAKKKIIIYQPEFIIIGAILSLVYLLFYYNTFISFFYEYYKLFVFAAFIPLMSSINYNNFKKILTVLKKLFIGVLGLNLLFIILQIVTNNQVLAWVGYSELRVSGWEKVGRYTGLFDVGTLGATALMMLIINELSEKKDKAYFILIGLSVISILASSSKTSYIIFFVWILIYFRKYLIKYILKITLGIILFLSIVIPYTYEAILSKIKQYAYFIEMLDMPHLINLGVVEMRAMFWAQAIHIFKNNPFGLGFGTFGDASSKYNPEAYKMSAKLWPERYVYLSDSSLAHLIAEQGVITFIYLFLISVPFFKAKKWSHLGWMMLVFYLIQIPFTMGFSAGTWPFLFALGYAIIYYENKFKKYD
ncbi:O-antigen ligase family protein [Mesonia sediminis]|uniref:O-antigen ligase family protein n=1 Tax=Mesonia sediminis TaxID=1703946 RepID=A0ABW5SF78_9FLAO